MTDACHFVCARCGQEFHKQPGWDPDHEAEQRFGPMPLDTASLCDPCDKVFAAWMASPAGQQALREWIAAGRP